MASKWLIKALEVEEAISRYHCVPSIFHWNTQHSKYAYLEKGNVFCYLWFSSFFLTITVMAVCTGALFWDLRIKTAAGETYPFLKYGAWFFVTCLGALSFGINLVWINHGYEFVGGLNLLLTYGEDILTTEKNNKSWKKSSDLIQSAIGLFALSSVLFLHCPPFIAIPFGLFFYPVMDPFHWCTQQLLGIDYPDTLPSPVCYLIFTVRFLLCFCYCSEVLRAISHMCCVMALESPVFYICLNYYRRFPLDYPVISQYTRLCCIRKITSQGCGQLTYTAMGVCFVMGTFTNVVCVYGWGSIDPIIFGCIVGAAVIQNALTHTALPLVTKLYDLSNGMLENWKAHVNGVVVLKKRRHLRKLLRSIRPIAFCCGSVGTLKKETKRNYFAALLDAFINLIMTFKEF